MKRLVFLVMAMSILFVGVALAGDGPFWKDKVRGNIRQERDLVPNHVTNWGGPLGVHKTDGGQGATVVRAGLLIVAAPDCPPVGETLEAMASPDLFAALSERTVLMPLAPMEFHPIKIVAMNDSGDDAMLYICIQSHRKVLEWANTVSLLQE